MEKHNLPEPIKPRITEEGGTVIDGDEKGVTDRGKTEKKRK